jgi:ubiquitin-activating enzyme E1
MASIDESLYSRQLYAIGKDTMVSLVSSRVLLVGLNPLGTEIAKNLVLSGIGMLTLADNQKITDNDFGNYYISTNNINKNRADVIGNKLRELNNNCIVNKYSGDITKDVVAKYHMIVFVDCCFKFNEYYYELNEFCRSRNIKNIFCGSRGFYGFIFCDFVNYYTNDPNGEKIKSGIIVSNQHTNCITDKPHDMAKDDKFKLNNSDTIYRITKIISTTEFIIDKSFESDIGEYTEIKNSLMIKFKSLRDSIVNPEFVITDFSNFEMPSRLHDINVKILSSQNDKLDMNDSITKKVVNAYDGFLTPMNSIIGGLVSHNVISGISNKYTPINQWLYYDCLKICDPEHSDCKYWKCSSIYQNQVKVIGTKLQEKLLNTKLFIVGSGAIGCEHLKNFSMMGIGNQTITDMDTIEKSNLSRQFLFRNTDIGKYKAEIAVQKVKRMNPNISIDYKLNRVGTDTENIFDRKFYKNIDVIVNALDNVNARVYMDNRAINYFKPLLESGTLGLKGNVQVILPELTESYGSTTDKAEDQIPICTLKNFPYEISHCIQWAREQFETLFVLPFQTYNKLKIYNNDDKLQEKIDKMLLNELFDIYQNLNLIKNTASEMFSDFYNLNYRQKIYDLITQFPEDHTTESGEKFWGGVKKFPQIIDFKMNNEMCKKLSESFQQIMINIGYESNMVNTIIDDNINTDLIIKDSKVATTTEEDKKNKELELESFDKDKLIEYIVNFIKNTNYKFNEIEFEKDDDTNGHIKFITSCSNLRALNYNINTASEFETKGIAGKIIPALATTTSIISGLVAIELYKLINYKSVNYKSENYKSEDYKLELFKNTFVGLGVCFMGSSEPIPCSKKRVGNLDISLWSQLEINDMDDDTTIADFIEEMNDSYNVVVSNIMYNDISIYTDYMNENKKQNVLQYKLKELIKTTNNILNICIYDANDDTIDEMISVEINCE